MSETALVSIIMPLHNTRRFVGQAVESVVSQSYKNWELIVVDDCSTDGGDLVVEAWESVDSRVILRRNAHNMGPGPSRNMALSHAVGEYVAFLDSDDFWHERKLELQLKFMKKNNSAFSFTGFNYVNEEGGEIGDPVKVPSMMSYKDLLCNTIILCSTVMMDVKKTPPLEMPSIRSRQNFVMYLRVLKVCGSAHGLDDVLSSYRVREGSVSSNKIRAAANVWRVYRDYENLPLLQRLWYFSNYAITSGIKNLGRRRVR